MPDIFCTCLYSSYTDEPVSTWSTVLELVFSIFIGICGITGNYKFLKKLREEKRNTPYNRKGNVIEPIMRWFCVVQMTYWPYHLLFFWITTNEIIPSEHMNGWWCNVMIQIGVKFGRTIVAYNSLFTALIRYVYIVHRQKSNQWEFEKVGRYFQISSIAIPVTIECIGVFFNSYQEYANQPGFNECIVFYRGLNSTVDMAISRPSSVEWTIEYLPASLVLVIDYVFEFITAVVFLNMTEGVLYLRIHQSISR
jgi:hypothetical protein